MESEVTVEPTYYNSLYKHGVDEKRRVQVPAMWRPERDAVEFTVILWPKAKEGPCLRVLPPEEMAELMREYCPNYALVAITDTGRVDRKISPDEVVLADDGPGALIEALRRITRSHKTS